MDTTQLFDGVRGRAVAKVMARVNRAAEKEAIEILDPRPDDRVLAIGIGPGVGVQMLLDVLRDGQGAGIDPARVMIDEARRRVPEAVERGTVELVRTTADSLPWPDAAFGGAVAVNSIQLWQPFDASVAEVARVLRPGARLVALTHDWAIRKSTGRDVDAWSAWASTICREHGLVGARQWRARAERGRSIVFTVTRDDPGASA